MTQSKILHYPAKVWLTTLVVASLLHSVFIQFYHNAVSIGDLIPSAFAMMLFSFAFSIPSFLLYSLLIYLLDRNRVRLFSIKLVGALSASICLFLTYAVVHNIMGGDIFHPKTIFFLSAYFFCIVFFSFLYDLNHRPADTP